MKIVKYLYLNFYAFLLVIAGILVLAAPLYRLWVWLIILQVAAAIYLFVAVGRIFSMYKSKNREIALLINRNSSEFHPDTFKLYMQAPCGRLVVIWALRQMGMARRYKELLPMKKSILENLKEGCQPVETVVYINKDF
jgi:hypothetical protein